MTETEKPFGIDWDQLGEEIQSGLRRLFEDAFMVVDEFRERCRLIGETGLSGREAGAILQQRAAAIGDEIAPSGE